MIRSIIDLLGFGSIGEGLEVAPDRMVALKQTIDGQERMRVLLRGSNQFRDRHKEIITEAAHKDYERWVSKSGLYPEFWIWHIKGSRWGKADFVGYSDGFLTVSGLVDKGKEELAEKIAGLDWSISHGFVYPRNDDDKTIIEAYRAFEFSPLPREAAANVWTAMKIAKEASLPLSENQVKVLTEDLKIPSDVVKGWEQENKGFGDALRASVEFKEANPEGTTTNDGTGTGSGTNNSNTPATPVTPAGTVETPAPVTLEAIGELMDSKLAAITGELAEVKQKQLEQAVDFTSRVNQVFDGVPRGLPLGYVATKANDNLSEAGPAKEAEDWFMDPSNPLIALPNGRTA